MEKKSRYRILGILIVIGLVVIALPLFQRENESSSHVALIQVPPFPEQSVHADEDKMVEGSFLDHQPVMIQQNLSQEQSAQIDTIPQLLANATTSDIPLDKQTNENKSQTMTNKPVSHTKRMTNKTLTKKSVINMTHSSITKLPLDNNGLIHLKGSVWVIQLGSFKDKSDALRLTNRLRLNGYKAFIQQVTTSFGNSTRVFVGPEYQQALAFELVQRLENHMHIRGVVVSYKPLTL
ncbi:MAG TPA: SPOR domain-containing protein [Gammaproteobacteria bacterium]|nr:SPOR domain-containing protein [Gammaproteobacteria bacterium]